MNTIINLTQHAATTEQLAQGVVDCAPEFKETLGGLLTFEGLPSREEIRGKANALAALAVAYGYDAALVGGAPYLMSALESALKAEGVKPLYAFSARESVETTLPDGKVVKTTVFRHLGFVES